MGERFFKITIGDAEIWMEAEKEVVTEDIPRKVSAKELAQRSLEVAEKITGTIRAYCSTMIDAFKDLADERRPEKITAEFGLKLSGEGNVYVVKSAGEASLKITAEWNLKKNNA